MKGLLNKFSGRQLDVMKEIKQQLITTDVNNVAQIDKLCELILQEFTCSDECILERYNASRSEKLAKML